jgi:hypothetical protein
VKFFTRLAQYRKRRVIDGPIFNLLPADKREIRLSVQRGRVVPDDHLVPRAIAYANFRARISRRVAILFLLISAVDLVPAIFTPSLGIFYAFASVFFLIMGILFIWQVKLYHTAARKMTAK